MAVAAQVPSGRTRLTAMSAMSVNTATLLHDQALPELIQSLQLSASRPHLSSRTQIELRRGVEEAILTEEEGAAAAVEAVGATALLDLLQAVEALVGVEVVQVQVVEVSVLVRTAKCASAALAVGAATVAVEIGKRAVEAAAQVKWAVAGAVEAVKRQADACDCHVCCRCSCPQQRHMQRPANQQSSKAI